jgi:hypothetical protein
METMTTKQEPAKKPQAERDASNEVQVFALYFDSQRDFPLEGVNGGISRLFAKDNRTITYFKRERQFRIIEIYADKRPTVVLIMPEVWATYQPML